MWKFPEILYILLSGSCARDILFHLNMTKVLLSKELSNMDKAVGITRVVDCYRPQTKFVKVMFLHLSVSHSVHRGVCI